MVTTSSTFIPISKFWGLLEYVYNSDSKKLSESGFIRFRNLNTKNLLYCSHSSDYISSHRFSNNTMDSNCFLSSNDVDINYAKNDRVFLDIETPIHKYENIESGWLIEDLTQLDDVFDNSTIINYDTLKVHVLRGYNFLDTDGFVIDVSYDDNKNNIEVANNVFIKQENLKYHTVPLRISDKLYDRYYEIKIPKIKDLKYIHDSSNQYFINKYSETNNKANYENIVKYFGFPDLDRAKIQLVVSDINSSSWDNYNRRILNLSILDDSIDNSKIQIGLYDEFQSINATIKESSSGDYFEYYASYNDQFISDWLSDNVYYVNSQFVLYHTIIVYEQYMQDGLYTEHMNQYFTVQQEDNFDEPFYFRPIVLNSNTSTFTIEYFLRMVDVNAICPSQIIRKSVLTYKNAKKYGRFLEKIDVSGINNYKIINKILPKNITSTNQSNYIENILLSNIGSDNILKNQLLFPMSFFNVSVNKEDVYVNESGEITTSINDKKLFAQNKLYLELQPFDNYIKFTIYNKQDNRYIPYRFDFNNSVLKYYICFLDSSGNKIKIQNSNQLDNILPLSEGEILFHISEENTKKIKGSKFWITMENSIISNFGIESSKTFKNFETVIYSGLNIISEDN